MRKLEIAAFNLESALIAQQNGAGRIELCKNMEVGGLTPEADALALAKEQLFVPVYVMVRPRAGNFVYDEAELAQMLQTILAYKELGADGFVFGILTADNKIDVARNKVLVAAASPLPCTFHRAFDAVIEWRSALEALIACGFKTVLSSGMAADVNSGIHNLKQMVVAAGNNIEIMPGGGVRAANLEQLMQATGARFFHSSAVLHGDTADSNEIQDMISILEA